MVHDGADHATGTAPCPSLPATRPSAPPGSELVLAEAGREAHEGTVDRVGSLVRAARQLEVEPRQCVVVEEAIAGVAVGRAGEFGLVVGIDRASRGDDLLSYGAHVVVTEPVGTPGMTHRDRQGTRTIREWAHDGSCVPGPNSACAEPHLGTADGVLLRPHPMHAGREKCPEGLVQLCRLSCCEIDPKAPDGHGPGRGGIDELQPLIARYGHAARSWCIAFEHQRYHVTVRRRADSCCRSGGVGGRECSRSRLHDAVAVRDSRRADHARLASRYPRHRRP